MWFSLFSWLVITWESAVVRLVPLWSLAGLVLFSFQVPSLSFSVIWFFSDLIASVVLVSFSIFVFMDMFVLVELCFFNKAPWTPRESISVGNMTHIKYKRSELISLTWLSSWILLRALSKILYLKQKNLHIRVTN